jgi:hypothetical protein
LNLSDTICSIQKPCFTVVGLGIEQNTNNTFLISPNHTNDFFQLYEDLFDQIPKEGDINSHQYILQKEADYLGVQIDKDDVQSLLDEITSLRQEVLDSQTIINELTTTTNDR